MATADARAYLLSFFDGELGIAQLTATPQRLSAFPEGFSRQPALPPEEGRDGAASLFAALETSKLPRGLYARGDHLYLLTREPTPEGTAWKVHQIDPEKDRHVRSMTLPTRANHVFLVPGPRWWAVVEKGAVTGPGQQAIPSAVLIPSRWIEDPGSNALAGPPPSCGTGAQPLPDEAG